MTYCRIVVAPNIRREDCSLRTTPQSQRLGGSGKSTGWQATGCLLIQVSRIVHAPGSKEHRSIRRGPHNNDNNVYLIYYVIQQT